MSLKMFTWCVCVCACARVCVCVRTRTVCAFEGVGWVYLFVFSQVTADGSMDCSKMPDRQEMLMAHLLFCQTVAAFFLLRPKGSFILKTFTTLQPRSVSLMYLLACCFNEVRPDMGVKVQVWGQGSDCVLPPLSSVGDCFQACYQQVGEL